MSTIAGQMIARAWVDKSYKRLLLDDARAALDVYPGAPAGWTYNLVCVEQSDALHNLIVCTPCSCYPVQVIGEPPAWYKDTDYRTRAVSAPAALLSDLGVDTTGKQIKTFDSDYLRRYMVLPQRPANTDGWTETQLADLVDQHNVVGAGPI